MSNYKTYPYRSKKVKTMKILTIGVGVIDTTTRAPEASMRDPKSGKFRNIWKYNNLSI